LETKSQILTALKLFVTGLLETRTDFNPPFSINLINHLPAIIRIRPSLILDTLSKGLNAWISRATPAVIELAHIYEYNLNDE
jgi:hypothetical protein